jgi:hypothetical protein
MRKINRKLLPKDKEIVNWLKRGGRKGAKEDFDLLIKKSCQPLPGIRLQPEPKVDQTSDHSPSDDRT